MKFKMKVLEKLAKTIIMAVREHWESFPFSFISASPLRRQVCGALELPNA